jgi:hypothetical protein
MDGGSVSQYELFDLSQSALSNSMACYAIFLSIVSGYLITAYLVGADLTRGQVRLLTILFLTVTTLTMWGQSGFVHWADQWSATARGEGVSRTVFSTQPYLPLVLVAVNTLTIAACLLFMWNIRRRRD